VEAAKIKANTTGEGLIDLALVEKGLTAPLTAAALTATLAADTAQIAEAAAQTLTQAGFASTDVTRIVLVGGSSLLANVSGAVHALLPTQGSNTRTPLPPSWPGSPSPLKKTADRGCKVGFNPPPGRVKSGLCSSSPPSITSPDSTIPRACAGRCRTCAGPKG
jgi:hypothetical protein